jgi:hypothetical protein
MCESLDVSVLAKKAIHVLFSRHALVVFANSVDQFLTRFDPGLWR